MTVEVLDDHEAVTAHAAGEVSRAIAAGPLTLGLPTGRTPIGLYDRLVRARLDWSRVRTFNLDEFASLGPRDAGSFRAFMDRHLFDRVDLPPGAIGFLQGDAADAEAECARYDAALDAAGGLDLLLLGLGRNGHVGFNEPGPTLTAASHVVTLHDDTRRANADGFGGDWRQVPARALTLGMRQILAARRVVLMATGPAKAEAVAAMVEGPLTTACPASWLQIVGRCLVVVDRAAASRLATRGR